MANTEQTVFLSAYTLIFPLMINVSSIIFIEAQFQVSIKIDFLPCKGKNVGGITSSGHGLAIEYDHQQPWTS